MELAQPQTDWVDHWAMAMILSLGPPSEEEFENAEFHFERAMALSPGLATSAVDRLAGHIRQGKASAALQRELRNLGRGQYSVNESSPWALQNQRALKRAIELLAQLREEIDD